MPDSAGYQIRRSRKIQRDKKRFRQLDWEDTRRPAWVAWLSLVCLLVMFLGVLALSTSDRTSKPQPVNGDTLGPFGVSGVEYQREADEKLAQADGDGPRWALVSPELEWSAEELTDLLRGFDSRVSTLLYGPGVQIPVPEPAVGHTRRDVIDLAAQELSRASQNTISPDEVRFSGVIVYAPLAALRELRDSSPLVFAVEPAADGAVLARMGIRSVAQG